METTEEQSTFDRLIAPLKQALAEIEEKRRIHHRESLSLSVFVNKSGVTIQFYLLLIVTLLQLHLKQACALACQSLETHNTPFDDTAVADRFVAQANRGLFFATVGDKLYRFWKVGLHWMQTLPNLLTKPFNHSVIEALGFL